MRGGVAVAVAAAVARVLSHAGLEECRISGDAGLRYGPPKFPDPGGVCLMEIPAFEGSTYDDACLSP